MEWLENWRKRNEEKEMAKLRAKQGQAPARPVAPSPTVPSAGAGELDAGARAIEDAKRRREQEMRDAGIPVRRKGGKVKKDGLNYLHKGERVLTAKQTKKLSKKPAVKKAIGVSAQKKAPAKKAAPRKMR